jgi:hypothetical protein
VYNDAADVELPAIAAKQMLILGADHVKRVVSSPFRRCLQTAGIVARTLGVPEVTVDFQLASIVIQDSCLLLPAAATAALASGAYIAYHSFTGSLSEVRLEPRTQRITCIACLHT